MRGKAVYLKKFYAGLTVILGLTACASMSQDGLPAATDIAKIAADPWAYHGKTVIVEGTFNECRRFTCRLCASAALVDSYSDEQTCKGVSFIDKAMDKIARYSTVRILANYDANCSGVQRDPNADEIIVCTDRASEFVEASVIEMITRRDPRQGKTTSYFREDLIEPSPETAANIRQAYRDQLWSWQNTKDKNDVTVFISLFQPQNDKPQQAAICECWDKAKICNKIKPTIEGHVFNLQSETPYSCVFAEKVNGTWRFPNPN